MTVRPTAPTRAALYLRISSDPSHNELGIDRQRTQCLEAAARLGWTITATYIDDDVSAFSRKRRPAFQELLADVRAGLWDGVMAWRYDRLSRRGADTEALIDLCEERGIALATAAGPVDLATSQGRLMARTLSNLASYESELRSERILSKHRQLAEAGKLAGGGTRPFGYSSDRLQVVTPEADVIQELADRLLAGDSLWSIANDFNARGIATVTGKEWSVHALRQIALSARISGQRALRGVVTKAVWPAIITPAKGTRLRTLLTAPERRTNRAPRRYLLAGMLRCAKCTRVLVARPRADGRRRYVCARAPGRAGCGGTFILADDVETLIASAVIHRLDSTGLATPLYVPQNDPAVQALLQGITDDQDQLDDLAAERGRGELSRREWDAMRAPILQRIASANATVTRINGTAALEAVLNHPGGVARVFSEIPLSRQQAVIKAVLDHATVGPAVRGRNRFDPTRISPAWRRA
jgi:site-specific DNA recombinase